MVTEKILDNIKLYGMQLLDEMIYSNDLNRLKKAHIDDLTKVRLLCTAKSAARGLLYGGIVGLIVGASNGAAIDTMKEFARIGMYLDIAQYNIRQSLYLFRKP